MSLYLIALPAYAQTSDCKLFSKSTNPSMTEAPRLVSYLRESSGHSVACDLEALQRLRFLSNEPVPQKALWVDVLARYLDFRRCTRECSGGLSESGFPAFDALQRIGEPASLAMIKIATDPNSTEIRRSLAISVVMWAAAPGAKGVKALADAARNSSSAEVILAIRNSVHDCAAEEQAACEAALTGLAK